ncbi:MAG: RDD family protein [Thermodesulfobacteriota bacterium]
MVEEILEIPINFEKEKKKNIRLAIGVASLAVLAFFAIYIASFLIMIYSPGWFFHLIPFPSFTENVAGFKGNLLLFSKSVEFKGRGFENPPEEKMVLRLYDGKSLSRPEEIQKFFSLYPMGDKIYFFNKGLYRTFDGKKWEDFKNSAIGDNPKGAIGPDGIYVLSADGKKPKLRLISENHVREILFPEDETLEKIYICSSKILYFENQLHLLCKNGNVLFWYKYDGENWSQPERFEDMGEYKAFIFKDKIYLFQIKDYGKRQNITLRTYSKSSWSEPQILHLRETSFNIKTLPAIFKESPILYQQGLFSEKYYFVNEGRVSGPFRISRPFFFSFDLWKMGVIIISSTAIYLLLAFLLSLYIGRFKLKRWKTVLKEYEFASLWRRFLADWIDTFITTTPFAVPAYFLFKEDVFFDNPFRFFALILLSMLAMLLVCYFYRSLLEGIWGKTVGKKICGIVVLKDDFTKCDIPKGLLRNLLRIVDLFFYYWVGVVSIVATMKWQRLGDIVAETVVVRKR